MPLQKHPCIKEHIDHSQFKYKLPIITVYRQSVSVDSSDEVILLPYISEAYVWIMYVCIYILSKFDWWESANRFNTLSATQLDDPTILAREFHSFIN